MWIIYEWVNSQVFTIVWNNFVDGSIIEVIWPHAGQQKQDKKLLEFEQTCFPGLQSFL